MAGNLSATLTRAPFARRCVYVAGPPEGRSPTVTLAPATRCTTVTVTDFPWGVVVTPVRPSVRWRGLTRTRTVVVAVV